MQVCLNVLKLVFACQIFSGSARPGDNTWRKDVNSNVLKSRSRAQWSGPEGISGGGSSLYHWPAPIIIEAQVVPGVGESVQVNFELRDRSVLVQLSSKVSYTPESEANGSFGVTFEERPDEVYLKLRPVLNL